MSLFNLDRFRFQKDKTEPFSSVLTSKKEDGCSDSPTSDKENKPARQKRPDSKHGRGVTSRQTVDFDESVSNDRSSSRKLASGEEKDTSDTSGGKAKISEEMEEKITKLMEMFPQRERHELLEVIESTSTLDGAVALCLVNFGDRDSNRQRGKVGPSEDRDLVQPSKRRRTTVSDSEEEHQEPSIEKQEAMLRKMQRKLPDLEKEVLRSVLQEHDWDYGNAIGSLLMFSSSDTDSPENKKKKPKVLNEIKPVKGGKGQVEGDEGRRKQEKTSSLSRWISSVPSRSSKTETQKLHNDVSTVKTSLAKSKTKAEVKREKEPSDSENEDPSSEVEDLSEDFDSEEEIDNLDTSIRDQIVQFLQDGSLDELTLISGCSLKKAQKIISLRPFKAWDDLKEQFDKDNGLSLELVQGCRVVLRQREVVLKLMGKCETIARKMMKDVTQVIEKGMGSMKQPSVLNSSFKLQPYQLIGLKWLILMYQNNLSGILADEMGLGKTIQAIAFLAHLYQKGVDGPHLITVPSSTLDNWVRELGLWCPALKVLVYYGSVEDRRYLRHDILNKEVEFNVIVTTYNLAIGNESDRSLFRKLKLKYAVFDEGHMLKNMNSLRYRHLMAINAEHRLLLTGTPLQNNLLELMSLLNFIMPSMFSSSTSQMAKMFSTKSSEEGSSFHKDRITQAKLIMKPFILRRVKSEVLKHLPPKKEKIEMCAMSEKQEQLYTKLFNKLRRSAIGEKKELCNVMMQLRKMANHPLLHRQYYTTEKLAAMSRAMLKEPTHYDADPALIQEDMEVMSDFELHTLCLQYSTIQSFKLDKELLLDSGKFRLLTKLLASLKDKGDRVVLFSQFTMMLDIVEVLLKHLDHRYVRLDGSTPMAERIGLIDKYNTNPEIFVFLLSTRAGGQGINLASANVVILHDIDCNPFNDKQAEDRCHRMGQTRTVQVIKLISKDTIEACMLRVGQEKLKLEQDMTTDEGDEGTMTEDMAELLKVSLGL